MKKILILFVIIYSSAIYSQNNLPYKNLPAFDNDTTAFMVYNFMDRAENYKGKTLKEVCKDLDISIKYSHYSLNFKTGEIDGIFLYIYDEVRTGILADKKQVYTQSV